MNTFQLGIDVAKAKLDCALRLPEGKLRHKVVENSPAGFTALHTWLTKQGVGTLHARISQVRKDFLHKTTTQLCRENQAIVVEDLNVQGMTASRRGDADHPGKKVRQKAGLNRSMLDVGFGEFRRQMNYSSLYRRLCGKLRLSARKRTCAGP